MELHSFQQSWSEQKHKRMLHTITRHIRKYKVRQVVIKIPDELPVSKPYIQLVGSLNVICKMHKLPTEYFTLKELKQGFFPDKKITKQALMNYLMQQQPEFKLQQQKHNRKDKRYYDKVYEALGVARLVYHYQHLPK